ncbi:MAG: hypothetical protein AAGM22_01565 [Acidobacteriota bacterium]
MFSKSSRYAPIPDLEIRDDVGRIVRYKARRFLPQAGRIPAKGGAVVRQGDRLDLIAARTLGQSQFFWRIADANDAMDPFQLTARSNRTLRVPVPQIEGPLPPQ